MFVGFLRVFWLFVGSGFLSVFLVFVYFLVVLAGFLGFWGFRFFWFFGFLVAPGRELVKQKKEEGKKRRNMDPGWGLRTVALCNRSEIDQKSIRNQSEN